MLQDTGTIVEQFRIIYLSKLSTQSLAEWTSNFTKVRMIIFSQPVCTQINHHSWHHLYNPKREKTNNQSFVTYNKEVKSDVVFFLLLTRATLIHYDYASGLKISHVPKMECLSSLVFFRGNLQYFSPLNAPQFLILFTGHKIQVKQHTDPTSQSCKACQKVDKF